MSEHILDNKERTFGLELEFADIVKDAVNLPSGYKYSPDETTMFNTNGKTAPVTGKFGGEINTRPLLPNRNDIRELRTFIKECFKAEGKELWNSGFDGHIYVGDLSLEHLKKIFALGFYISPLIYKIFEQGEWMNVEYLIPLPTFEVLKRVMNAETEMQLKEVFANSSNRGYVRYTINIMAYFAHKTIEFRLFNTTRKFRETLECIKFMYNFINYAVEKDIEDFKNIRYEEDVIRIFDIKRNKIPKITQPLIFAENHTVATSSIAKAFQPSRKILTAVKHSTGKKIATINPFMFASEVALYKDKTVTVYNNNEFNHVIYRICTEDNFSITYNDRFEVLNQYKDGSKKTELALLFIFQRIQKYSLATEHGIREYFSYIDKIKESIAKLDVECSAFIEMFGNITYKEGNLSDAIKDGEKTIIFQQEHYGKFNSAVQMLKKYSDYAGDFNVKEMTYHDIEERVKSLDLFEVISKNVFLPFHKIAKDKEQVLYSTVETYKGVSINNPEVENIMFKIPENDYEITENSKIVVSEVTPTIFSMLQHSFVKKVVKFQTPRMCYVIRDGETVLGAFGFDYPKDRTYSLFLLSDFCTNNDVRLLSKFVLFVIKTKEVKRMIERKMIERVENCYTRVYTTRPVSMKYRGAFNKVKHIESERFLTYDFTFGEGGTIKEAITEYLKRKKQNG